MGNDGDIHDQTCRAMQSIIYNPGPRQLHRRLVTLFCIDPGQISLSLEYIQSLAFIYL